jgi:methylthioribose-1-phosphate isomerase
MMDRQDKDLAWMLQYENIAWYEDGRVDILDRRVYPIEVRKVSCHSHEEVARAIKDMVTQSAGPYVACSMGMALAAYECRGRTEADQIEYLEKALGLAEIKVVSVKNESEISFEHNKENYTLKLIKHRPPKK